MKRKVGEAFERRVAPVAKTARRPIMWLVPVFVAVVGFPVGFLLYQLSRDNTTCSFAKDELPFGLFFIGGIVSFFIGHFIGGFGALPPQRSDDDARRLGRISVALGFLMLSGTMVFEAFGTANYQVTNSGSTEQLEPITFYVRCAVYQDLAGWSHGAITGLVIVLSFFLAGFWLWGAHPAHPSGTA